MLVNLDIGYSNQRISDASAKHLLNLKMLTDLNIYDSRITDKTLLTVPAKLPNLRTVELTTTHVTTPEWTNSSERSQNAALSNIKKPFVSRLAVMLLG